MPYAVNFAGKRITITFNEYVQLRDQQKVFFMSPAQAQKPTLAIKNRSIVIDFQDTLKSNTTYRLDFGGSIIDNNEGNKIDGYSFVFSTGPVIDSLMMVGQVVDAFSRDSVIGAFINYFDSSADSSALDSVLYKSQADAVFRTDSSGYFVADILQEKPYRVYAFLDNNGDQRYQAGTDLVAFMDTLYNPVELPDFSFHYDSLARRTIIDDLQVNMEVFKEKAKFRQNIMGHSRVGRNRLNINFAAPDVMYDSLLLTGVDQSWLIKDKNKNGDSITFWIAPPTKELFAALPDSIYGSFVYQRQDSVFNYFAKKEKLNFYNQVPKKVEDKKAKNDTLPKKVINPFGFEVKASQVLNPEKGVEFVFNYPIRSIDSARIELIRTEADKKSKSKEPVMIETAEKFYFDSLGLNRFVIRAPWRIGAKYDMVIPSGVFEDIAFLSNDTLKSQFTIADPDKFGTLSIVTTADTTDKNNYIFELTTTGAKDRRVVARNKYVKAGDKFKFRYLAPGRYSLRIIEDVNHNAQWDTGVLTERKHPEKSRVYTNKGNSNILELKENWDIIEDVSFKKLFK